MPLPDKVPDDEACSISLVAVRVALGAGEAQRLNLSVCDLLVLCRRDERERHVPQRGTGSHDPDTTLGCGLVGRVRLPSTQDEVFGQYKVYLVLPQTIRPSLVRDELLDEAVVVAFRLAAVNERRHRGIGYVNVRPTGYLA